MAQLTPSISYSHIRSLCGEMASEFVRLDCIGSGSFGKVWLVRYSANGRNYVLKEVQVRGLTDKEIDQAVSEVRYIFYIIMSWYQLEDIELANYYVDQPFLIGNNESRNFNICHCL